MHYRITRLLALLAGVLLTAPDCGAQDVLMARGNTQLTVSTSLINNYKRAMQKDMSAFKGGMDYLKRFDYTVDCSMPLSFTAEYAVTSYTTLGLNANYFTYSLTELREDALGTIQATTKGSHLDLHLRAVRYFFATPGSSMYVLGEIGLTHRSIQYTGDANAAAYINTFPETRKDGYKTLSYDYGIGLRVRLFHQVGVSAEFTMLSVLGRYGVYYIIPPAGRRTKDQIGW